LQSIIANHLQLKMELLTNKGEKSQSLLRFIFREISFIFQDLFVGCYFYPSNQGQQLQSHRREIVLMPFRFWVRAFLLKSNPINVWRLAKRMRERKRLALFCKILRLCLCRSKEIPQFGWQQNPYRFCFEQWGRERFVWNTL